ncbi:hypothetical protein [Luteolibacter soli]|uniref:DUF3471 domain-containing protein n=1 Tax=Luteolibacter soli TaxID=3135280 RepID=A0ABU9AW12_9BACT
MLFSIFLGVGAIAQELPDEVRLVTEAHEKEVRRLKLAYLQDLDALAERYRKADEPEKAKAVAELIARTEKELQEKEKEKEKALPRKESEVDLKLLVGTWRRNTDGKVWKIESEKGGVFNGKDSFTMAYDAEKRQVVVTAAKGWVNTLEFTDDENVMSGSWEKDGRKTFELTREKASGGNAERPILEGF